MNGSATASAPPSIHLKAPRQPILWAAGSYSLGILAGAYLWRPASWWIVSGILLACASGYWIKQRCRVGWLVAFAVFFFFGAFHIHAHQGTPDFDNQIQPYADGQELQFSGHVTRAGPLQPGPEGEKRQVLEFRSENVTSPTGEILAVCSGIRLTIYSQKSGDRMAEAGLPEGAGRVFLEGERLQVTAKLRRPRNFRNPGAFDYEGYLRERNIAVLGSVKVENIEVLTGQSGNYFSRLRSQLHRGIVRKVHELWPEREAALIDAMVIGEEAFIDRDTRMDFQRSGTYHVLVVSGMNVSILTFVVFWVLRRLHLGEIVATALSLGFCAAYAMVTDVGAPVWRATLMCAVYMATRLLYRERAMLNALGVAALALLVYDPQQLFTASFQMTFLCVLIVAGIGIPILERTSQLYRRALIDWDSTGYSALLPPQVAQFQVELQFIALRLELFVGKKWSRRLVRGTAKIGLAAWELIFVSAVMQMGLALPMAIYFHRATTIGLPANLLVVPLTQLMMPSAVAALTVGYVSMPLAKMPALLTMFAIDGIAGSVHGLGALRSADLRMATPSLGMIAIATAAVIFSILAARRRQALAAAGVAALLIASLALAFVKTAPQLHPGIMEMTSIDVGEGDSELLVTPQGRTLLVDAGGPIGLGGSRLDFGEDVVSPYLWGRGISRLDAVAITHGHSDHIGGMEVILKNFHPRELWVGLLPPSNELGRVISTAHALGVTVVRHWEGDSFEFGGATFEVLAPPQDWFVADKPRNNDSLVMRVSFKENSILLEGDAEKQVERRVAALHHPQATLLKVGHHGSANATIPELLDSAKPQFAVISVGTGNSFGLPRLETLKRLQNRGTHVYRTDVEGAVTFYLDGHSVTPSVEALR